MRNLSASVAQTLLRWSLHERLDEIEDSNLLSVLKAVPVLKLNWRRQFPLERLTRLRDMVRAQPTEGWVP